MRAPKNDSRFLIQTDDGSPFPWELRQEVLLAWAARTGVQVRRCADCLRRLTLPMEGATNSSALTAFSWGYWGWGNSVPQFLQAATAHESAKGFQPPAFADVRLRRSVRAPGFNEGALEKVVGPSRYRWFKRLGNANIATGESGVQIADPAEAHALLEFVQEQAAAGRRVLFFCACPIERLRDCHRQTVATLLLRSARDRNVDLTVVEWPGGDPESRNLRLTTAQEGASVALAIAGAQAQQMFTGDPFKERIADHNEYKPPKA